MSGQQTENSMLVRLDERVNSILRDVGEIKDGITLLIRVEERQTQLIAALDRAFSDIRAIGGRVEVLEKDVPVTNLVKGWVIRAVVGVACIVGTALVYVVLK